MDQARVSPDRLELRDRLPWGTRLVLVVLGLIPLMAPYELLLKPRWSGFGPLTFFFGLISLGALAVSAAFILGGLFGLDQTLSIDGRERRVRYAYKAPLLSLRRREYPFSAIKRVEVAVHDWESRPESYGLEVELDDGRKIRLADVPTREEAERWVAAVRGWMTEGESRPF